MDRQGIMEKENQIKTLGTACNNQIIQMAFLVMTHFFLTMHDMNEKLIG